MRLPPPSSSGLWKECPRSHARRLISVGRFRAIDGLRRRARFDASLADLANQLETNGPSQARLDEEAIEDDRLRLIFTCCHPALPPDAQIAMTLREICGLTTEEIAHAYLTTPSTVAQRIVRAKAKIRDARIPYHVPQRSDLPARLDSVLHVIYLVFNEGYAASSGAELTRPNLSGEAIRLGRLLVELLPEPEAEGLLALMLLHESRRAARTSANGELVLLSDQDRSRWNRRQIEEGAALVAQALRSHRFGSVHASGSGRGHPCRSGERGRDRLVPDCCAVRSAAPGRLFANRRTESCRRDCDARRTGGRTRDHRRHPGSW